MARTLPDGGEALEAAGALAISTLANVHGAHPNTLEYSTGGCSNGTIRFPNLGIRRASNC